MKTKYKSERTAALVEEVIAILERLENAPESPLTIFLTTTARRKARRNAKQLRKGQLEPSHPDIHTRDSLATALDRAADRDAIVEKAGPDLIRNGKELRRVAAEEGQCPDCDDNALEPTVKGEAFPTGQPHPPAHPGCRCLLVPQP
jgi:hypothetical protein